MQGAGDPAIDLFVQKDCTHHLDTASGRSRARGKTAQEQDPDLREHRPHGVVVCGEPERSGQRNHVKRDVAQCGERVLVCIELHQVERKDDCRNQQRPEKPGQLCILQIGARTATHQGNVVGGEVHPRKKGKQDRHALDRHAVETTQARIPIGEPPQPHDGEGMDHRLPRVHAGPPQGKTTGYGQQHIHRP